LAGPARAVSTLEAEFVRADLDAAAAMLDFAEDESLFGTLEGARRALADADRACADGQERLARLNAADRGRLGPRIANLRGAIDRMQPRFGPSTS